MSCSRLSWFLAATSMRAKAVSMSARASRPSRPAAVRVAAPDRVDLGEIGVAAPVAGVDQRQQSGAVRAGLGAEDAAGGAALVAVPAGSARSACDVRAQRVVGRGLVQRGDGPDRVVEQRDHVGEGVAEEAADAHRDVDARPAEFADASSPRSRSRAARRRPRPAELRAMPAPLRCRRPGYAWRWCPRPSARRVRGTAAGVGAVAVDQRGGERDARSPRPAATGWPWGRRSRSCARSAAR